MQKKLKNTASLITLTIQSLKYFSVIFMMALLPGSLFEQQKVFCTNQYLATGAKVCSSKAMSEGMVKTIASKVALSLSAYLEFASDMSLKIRKLDIPITVFVISIEDMNNQKIFIYNTGGRTVGRYTKDYGHIYVTPEMFTHAGRTDLEHEMAHYGNNHILAGISKAQDEQIAYDFEAYILKKYGK